jgi:NAD(P)-dependent dehydrogenase (short-subunit alcohol dehydrogenase family)
MHAECMLHTIYVTYNTYNVTYTLYSTRFTFAGQTNYAAAKMAILGLTSSLAKEGEKHNILVNCVVPIAKSRMTATTGLPNEVLDRIEPEHVASMV